MLKLHVALTVAVVLTGDGRAQMPRPPLPAGPSRFLAVWTGDEDRRNSDFLAILDVGAQEHRFGSVVTTLPVGFRALDPHHTEHALDSGRILFANGYAGDRSFRFDLHQPQHPVLLGPVAVPPDVHYIHSLVRAPGGRLLATYQAEGPDREGAGGIAEFASDGTFIRKSSARVDGIEPALLRPYSMAVVPLFDRIVVGCAAMPFPPTWDEPHANTMRTQMEHEHRGIHVQVYRLSDLQLLETIALPDDAQDGRTAGAKEPRLLADGRTVLMSTGQGALFEIDHLESRASITRVFTFDGERCGCGVPIVVGHFWIQPMANAHSIVSLDVADPAHPKEVSRVRLGDRLLAHWLSWDPGGNRLIVVDSGAPGGEHRVWLVTLTPTTGRLEIDRRFRNPGSDEPGFSFDIPDWPHGATGPAVPHGAVFVP